MPPSQSVTPIQPSTATERNDENICTVNILTYADAVAASRLNEVVPQNKLFRSAYLPLEDVTQTNQECPLSKITHLQPSRPLEN